MDSTDDRRLNRTLARHLQGWRSSGATGIPRIEQNVAATTTAAGIDHPPVDRRRIESESVTAAAVSVSVPVEIAVNPPPSTSPVREPLVLMDSSTPLTSEQRIAQLSTIAGCVADCRRCPELAETRTQTVFGVGDPDARLLFIGEAPGADEDRTGEPFVGRAGQLLTKIIEACGWTRGELYICNILKCRPPQNRNPSHEEAANCREYLDAQIATVAPEYIVCWGSIAAKNLLDSKEPIGRLRKKFFQYGGAKVLCTYHPSYLLRNPPAKKEVWDDMKFLMHDMGIDPDQVSQ